MVVLHCNLQRLPENAHFPYGFIQAQFAQMRPIAMAPTVAPRMPMYAPGGPGLGQQIFYGQPPPAIIPPQVKYSSHASLL